jgi:hypothetical protein
MRGKRSYSGSGQLYGSRQPRNKKLQISNLAQFLVAIDSDSKDNDYLKELSQKILGQDQSPEVLAEIDRAAQALAQQPDLKEVQLYWIGHQNFNPRREASKPLLEAALPELARRLGQETEALLCWFDEAAKLNGNQDLPGLPGAKYGSGILVATNGLFKGHVVANENARQTACGKPITPLQRGWIMQAFYQSKHSVTCKRCLDKATARLKGGKYRERYGVADLLSTDEFAEKMRELAFFDIRRSGGSQPSCYDLAPEAAAWTLLAHAGRIKNGRFQCEDKEAAQELAVKLSAWRQGGRKTKEAQAIAKELIRRYKG